ncbi:hypothetical protein E2C01_008234 [Portunus trituberculatus]|uniref:Uncharacterized protein n=1 Tax=Portunus trituberculatus TaxID=210409 RepID=A0A5B7D078_PORTR|nr:hypothetical protein [Portunus trituberculatus]
MTQTDAEYCGLCVVSNYEILPASVPTRAQPLTCSPQLHEIDKSVGSWCEGGAWALAASAEISQNKLALWQLAGWGVGWHGVPPR